MDLSLHIWWPQIVVLLLLAVSVFYNTIHQGEPKPRSGVVSLIDAILWIAILAWGGFFTR